MRRWDETEKAGAVRILGLIVAAVTVFTAISVISYLFHWKEDMSLAGQVVRDVSEVGNVAGALGFKTGKLLIGDLFGLGSFFFVLILAALTVKIFTGRWSYGIVKSILIPLTGALVWSLALAFAGKLAGMPYAFGGGLGGACGAWIVGWGELWCGTLCTGIFIVLLVFCWLFFSSRRFTAWIAGIGVRERDESAPEEEAPAIVEDTFEPEPAIGPEPEPEAVEDLEPAVPEFPQDAAGDFEVITGDGLDTNVEKELEPIDNRLDPPDGLPRYKFPSLDILADYAKGRREVPTEELSKNNNKIRAALANYHIQVNEVKAVVGPTVTLYKVYPAPGVQIAQIKRLQDDIAMSLNAKGVRVVTLTDSVGIEVANEMSSIVPLKALLNDDAFRNSKADLPVAIGYTITQQVKVFDLADAPHLLIAGATKQGKSVGLNVIVNSLLFSKHPSELKFVFIDPKMVEFSAYAQLLRHFLAVLPDAEGEDEELRDAIVKKPKDAEKTLRSLCLEMDQRYELLSEAGVNNIKLYNEKYKSRKLRPDKGHRYLPFLVVVVDEYADLTMSSGAGSEARSASRSITNSIIRLAQKGRAAGMHVIIATQRPSVDVISGVIKGNFPLRIAFRVASRVDSQTILDNPGAEKLIGKGDMLFYAGVDMERIQCGYVSGAETECVTEFIGSQTGYGKAYNTPYYLPEVGEAGESSDASGGGMVDMGKLDERFEEAARMVVSNQRGSTSDLQRKLGMGYAKAGRVMDQLEAAGIVGPQDGSKPRQVLIRDFNELQPILDAYMKR